MAIQINGTLDVRWPSLIDKRSGKLVGSVTVPYDTIEEVDTLLNSAYRVEGLIVYVRDPDESSIIKWFQFQGGITIDDIVDVSPFKRPYRAWSALISQSGTDAPVINLLFENTLGVDLVFSYEGVGFYKLTTSPLTDVFTLNKTVIPGGTDIFYSDNDITKTFITPTLGAGDLSSITIQVMSKTPTLVVSNNGFYRRFLEIRVYN